MARSMLMKDEDRDLILMQSLVYRKTQREIAKTSGKSPRTVNLTLQLYWAVNEENWERLAQTCCSYDVNLDSIMWAEKANQKKVPQDVLDMIFKKPEPPKEESAKEQPPKEEPTKEEPTKEEPPKPDAPKAEPSMEKLIEQNEQIISCLWALADGMPQILTAISYLDKRIKDEFHGNFDPLMGYVKTINENLVGVKCNTRLLKKLEDK